MSSFTAKDVQALRQATGAGMMDAKKALTEADGDADAAAKWLREKGLVKAASRADRANTQGAVAVSSHDRVAAMVELRSETDFSAKAEDFTTTVQTLVDAVAAGGEDAIVAHKDLVENLNIAKKENIEVGRVARVEAAGDNILDAYLHRQEGRGVNGVIVELAGGTPELAHDIAVHIAFTKPRYLRREDVPADQVAEERATLESITRAEGKPEAAMDKIVEGRLTGWFKDQVLLEQGFVRDEKQTVAQLLGDAELVRFVQVVIGS
ncbi:translation elongation factor Ts [soil metagenome]